MKPATLVFALCLLVHVGRAETLAESVDGRSAVIIDGDTVAIGGERIRLLNVDAPESFRPRCERELVAGLRAKERLAELLRAGYVWIERQGQDRYRRTLARLLLVQASSGAPRDVGAILVSEGLAVLWQSGRAAWEWRRRHWCGD